MWASKGHRNIELRALEWEPILAHTFYRGIRFSISCRVLGWRLFWRTERLSSKHIVTATAWHRTDNNIRDNIIIMLHCVGLVVVIELWQYDDNISYFAVFDPS